MYVSLMLYRVLQCAFARAVANEVYAVTVRATYSVQCTAYSVQRTAYSVHFLFHIPSFRHSVFSRGMTANVRLGKRRIRVREDTLQKA